MWGLLCARALVTLANEIMDTTQPTLFTLMSCALTTEIKKVAEDINVTDNALSSRLPLHGLATPKLDPPRDVLPFTRVIVSGNLAAPRCGMSRIPWLSRHAMHVVLAPCRLPFQGRFKDRRM